ncbi:MAG: SPOR domain-containing protein [Thermodesulfobacteriota bacterium]
MEIKKFLHTNRGFFLLSLVAAIVGTIASIFFGGCSSNVEEQSNVIAQKRVKIDIQEIVPDDEVPGRQKAVAKRVDQVRSKADKDGAPAVKPPVKTASRAKAAKKTVRKKQRTVRKKASIKAASGTWAVNVASFTKSADAMRLRKKLIASGRSAYITEFTKDGTFYYRVRVGFFTSRESAKRVGRAISRSFKNTGDAWVVQPGKAEIASHTK